MDTDPSRIQQLVDRPAESLAVEVKRWLNPDEPAGIAKIVRVVLALRNHNGGYLVLGFDDETLKQDQQNAPSDVESLFHIDKIQGLISKYASEPFEVSVAFPEREGQKHVVIVVPSGVKTPVASKADLVRDTSKNWIDVDAVYVRSLRANNTPSTTRATWKDWPNIVEVCFDNREADIGRFLRRHLGAASKGELKELAAAMSGQAEPETIEESLRGLLQRSEARFQEVVEERKVTLPEHGTWEVALILEGDVPNHAPNTKFITLLESSNPGYTGWPVWLDSRSFADENTRPYVHEGIWEALIVSIDKGWSNQIDFMRKDPRGQFFLLRALRDDVAGTERAPTPMTELDFGMAVIRTAEAFAVGIAFARAMGCETTATTLAFAVRWTRLRGRELSSWVKPDRYISPGRKAYQDDVTSYVNIPLDTPLSALGSFVEQAVQPLFEVFDGFELGIDIFDDLTRRVVERRL